MKKAELKIPRGYNAKTQGKIGLFAAQLDDQLARLKKEIADLTVEQLEWQIRPGHNTIGMLLAHFAVVETWWIKIAPNEIPWDEKGKAMLQKICGIEDDGMPVAADGVHPEYLKGFTAQKYIEILTKTRRVIHTELKKWKDRDLDKFYNAGKAKLSRTWTLYHVLEHFCVHLGQILLVKHLMRDAGVLAKKEEKGPGA